MDNTGQKKTILILLLIAMFTAGLIAFFYKEQIADYLNENVVEKYAQPVETQVDTEDIQVREKEVMDLDPFVESKFKVLESQAPKEYWEDPSSIPGDIGSASSVRLFKDKLLFDSLKSS